MGFVEKVKNVISKLRAAGKTEKEVSEIIEQAAEAADCLIRIPMCGKVESLNAAMASGILMYEAARQRRE